MLLDKIVKSAKGDAPVDLLLKNGKIINVLSGEIYQDSIAILGDIIVGVDDDYEAKEEIDLEGLYVAPGFIDGHIHIESSMLEVSQFARAVVPLGTTSVVADPHEIANVLGYEGIRYMMDASKYNPLNVFFMLPSCVPSTSLESTGSTMRAFDIFPFLREKWVLGLAEVMNFTGVLDGNEEVLDKLKIVEEKRIDGHAPGLSGKDLCAYIAMGISSDHECTTVKEAEEKLRLGMHIMIREGTGTKNLLDLLPLVTKENERRCFFVTDDRHPNDILEQGHINFMIKTAMRRGLNPMTAIRMATLNTAEYFGLRKLGAIAPGRIADLVMFDDFDKFNIKKVFKNGRLVAEDGNPVYEMPLRPPAEVRSSMNIKWLEGDEFKIPAHGKKCRVMGIIPDQIVTESLIEDTPAKDGMLVSDTKRDLLRCYVVERHKASGNIGKGLVHGFGLQKGALASSIGHDSHNIIVLGVDDDDIQRAVIEINKMGGGLVVVADGEVKEKLDLPIAGLMSRLPIADVSKKTDSLNEASYALGVKLKDPFMTMSFLALPVVPKLKLTDFGLVDVEKYDFVDLFLDE